MNYYEKVRVKDLEFQEVENRMKNDSDLLYMKRYVMMDRSGKHAVPDVINATLNKPAVFFANVIANLGAVKQQVVVESLSAKVDTTTVEGMVNAVLDMANLRLRKMRYPLLNPFADVQFCARGRTGRRVLVRQDEDGSILADVMPWDGRFIRQEIDDEGLVWASYATNRTKSQVLAEYGIETKSDKEIVLDVWDREHEEVWVGNRMVKETPHDFGYCPVVITSVPLGYGDILLDESHEKREGESIFYLIRDIVPQLNMMLTILQTLNFMSVKRPMNYVNKDGKLADPPKYDDAISPGAVTSADLGGGLMPIEFGDATKAAQLAYSMLEKAIQEGGYTDIDIGNVQQPFSAVALMTIGEGKDQVLLPRLAAKEILNTDTAEMALRQIRELGSSVELGVPGHTTKYQTSKLDGEYTVGFKYFTKNPKIDVARVNVAMQAAQFYPRSYLYSEVLQVEDPNGMLDDWYSQQAEQLDPNVLKHRIIQSLLKKAEEHDDEQAAIEAMIMSQGLEASMEASRMGVLPGEKPKQAADKSGDMSLLPPSGAVESGVGMNPSQFEPMPVMAGTAGG